MRCVNFDFIQFLIIMNSKMERVQVFVGRKIESETKDEKQFVSDSFGIDYVNTSKIYHREFQGCDDPKVINYLCSQNGNNLKKVTEICFGGKVIRIEDNFEINLKQEILQVSPQTGSVQKKMKTCGASEKVRIFSNNVARNGKTEKKDKKNIVKNIVKLFIVWLQNKQRKLHKSQAFQSLKKFMKMENFNNRLIKQIIESDDTCKIFYRFLSQVAHEEVQFSRINDKNSHYEAIELYLNLIQEKSEWKSKDREESGNQNSKQRNTSCKQGQQTTLKSLKSQFFSEEEELRA